MANAHSTGMSDSLDSQKRHRNAAVGHYTEERQPSKKTSNR